MVYHTRILVLFTAILLLVSSAFSQRKKPKKEQIQGHTMFTLLKPGDIPAIFDPKFTNIYQAARTYYQDEQLLMVRDGDEVKGYSIWYLDKHEIVNDYINGKAITVTW